MMELVEHVRLGTPEAARERDELRGRKLLPAEHQHLTSEKRRGKLGERRIGKRLRKIDVLVIRARNPGKAAQTWTLQSTFARLPRPEPKLANFGNGGCRPFVRSGYFKNSGRSHRGSSSGISGHTIIMASTSSIGISMIIVSLRAKRNRTFAIAQEISRHNP